MEQKPQTEKSAMPIVLGIAGVGAAGAGLYFLLKGKKPTPPPAGPWTLMTPTPTLLAVKKAIGTAVWQLMTPQAYTLQVAKAVGTAVWQLMTPTPRILAVTKAVGVSGWVLMTPTPTILAVKKAIGTAVWQLMTLTPTTLAVAKAVGVSGWTLMTPTPTVLAVTKATGTGNYALTTDIDPVGVGFVERTYLGITRADNYLFPPGAIVTIRAWPYDNTQWVFMHWLTPAGAELTLNPMDVQMNQNTNLTAHFQPIQGPPIPVILNAYTSPSNAGFIQVSPPGIHFKGDTITLQAFGYAPYTFLRWVVNGTVYEGNPISVTLDSDTDAMALFSQELPPPPPPPPPPPGPVWPAPGGVGDGMVWFWIVFLDNSAAWYDQPTYIAIMQMYGDQVKTYYGPYPSGATS